MKRGRKKNGKRNDVQIWIALLLTKVIDLRHVIFDNYEFFCRRIDACVKTLGRKIVKGAPGAPPNCFLDQLFVYAILS